MKTFIVSFIRPVLHYVTFLCALQNVVAQSSNVSILPQVVPPTPQASSLGRFGSYPVSHYTGIPDIQIPLYEIIAGDLKVPVSLNYHSSGIKVTDRASWAGLGWSLQCGGQVSRKIMGLEDEHVNGYLNKQMRPVSELDRSDLNDLEYLNQINTGILDTEPDIFAYNFGGYSGHFVFDQKRNFAVVKIPYTPLTIRRTGSLSFEMVTERGDTYSFKEVQETDNTVRTITTAWLLSRIISAEKQDTVRFSYTARSGQTHSDRVDYTVVSDMVESYTGTAPYLQDLGIDFVKSQGVWATEQRLSEVTFPLGKLVFQASSTDREDGFAGQKKLNSINIYTLDPATGAPVLLKTIQFHHSYFISSDGSDCKRLRLDSLTIMNGNSAVVQRYSFDYNSLGLPDVYSKSRDYWGYYNNIENTSLVPFMEIPYQGSATAPATTIRIGSSAMNGRESDPYYMQACVLKKITYPTGGWTEFTYNANQYLDQNNQPKYAGGLRIEQIRSYDGINPEPLTTTYRYGTNESGYGRANFHLSNYFFQSETSRRFFRHELRTDICPLLTGKKRERTFVASSSIDMEAFDSSPVTYSTLTEYAGTVTDNAGKTVYTYSDPPDNFSSPILYGQPRLKTYHFRRGLLLSKTEYKKTPEGYRRVHTISNVYQAFPDSLITDIGFLCRKNIITDYKQGTSPADNDIFTGVANCGMGDSDSYVFGFYAISTGDNKLISTTDIYYDQNDESRSLQLSVKFSYENYLHQQITKTTTSNSLGQSVEFSVKFPHETSGAVYNAMVQKNRWAFPVQETTKINGVQVEKITRNYFNFYPEVFRPEKIYRQSLATDPNDLEVAFSGYDLRGNPLGYIGRDQVPHAVVWGYKQQVPICHTINAIPSEVFYTSFEETRTGTSVLQAKTGARSWYNAPYNITLSSAAACTLSYWKKVGNGPWEYIQTALNGGTVSIGGTNTWIDEVRVYPSDATMSTFTYKPAIGTTSVNDGNSRSTLYDFDSIGRLQCIKDHDGNIMKSYEYKYIRP
jgi:hypothetical protein